MIPYLPNLSKVQEVDNTLTARADVLCTLIDNLVLAQNHMKQQDDQHCFEHHFDERGLVFSHLQPYKQTSLKDEPPKVSS
jgi:hypothetical protein